MTRPLPPVWRAPRPLAAPALALLLAGCAADAPPTGPDALAGPRRNADPIEAAAGGAAAKRGSITVTLVMRPEGAADVAFTTDSRKLRDFALDDDADPALPNTITLDNVKPGTYAIRMANAPDGPLTAIRCTSAGGTDNNTVDVAIRTATLNVDAGEAVACTFVDGWEGGDLTTYSQEDYGYGTVSTPPASLVAAHFSTFYGNDLIIGGTLTARFESAFDVGRYLPQVGGVSIFTKNTLNATDTSAGEFGGQLVALTLNMDFSGAGILPSVTPLGGLFICGYPVTAFNGMTVASFYAAANSLIGGTLGGPFTTSEGNALAEAINLAFRNSGTSAFAQESLFVGGCP